MPPRRPPRVHRQPTPSAVDEQESENAPTPQNVSPTPPPPPPPDRKISELFLRQNPPTFTGDGNPSEAEKWVRAMDRIFKFLECTDKEKMLCVSFQLKGPADYWWESRQKIYTLEQLENLTCDQFKEELYGKYVPRSYRKQKEIEFANLKQGKKTVAEYDREFCNLARYAPHKVDTDQKIAELFRSGLRQDIRVILASQPQLSYAETLNRALDMELEMQPEKKASDADLITSQKIAFSKPTASQKAKGKRKWETKGFPEKRQWQGPKQFMPRQLPLPTQSQQQNFPNPSKSSMCPKCGRLHSGVCKWGSNSCYTCGQVGHYSNNCPNHPKQASSGGK